ncbi:MAG TPA: endonuclease/exonuclease/phosphatase family protein, partial [Anaeromyxobacteraceae bacterium]|nr:endonuclease/exonuclease/phosphatase family protein [Anaeromyxobacteraceae bacterium]
LVSLPPQSRAPVITVMTYNVYYGADLARVLNAPSADQVPLAVAETWDVVNQTFFPARAEVLADEIAAAAPHAVGLQEVALWRTGPPDSCAGALAPNAEDVAYDFLAILLEALSARGVEYQVAAVQPTYDFELCSAAGEDVRITDRDVVLVRSGVPFRNAGSHVFSAEVTASFPISDTGITVPAPRAWNSVEVEAGGRWVRFVEAHIEDYLPLPDPYPPYALQVGQALELLASLAALEPLPTILAGDFNTAVLTDPTYPVLVGMVDLGGFSSPFRDAWTRLKPVDPGYTWGFDELLLGGALVQRLDLVLATPELKPTGTKRVGVSALDAFGRHPSDHTGLVTAFAVP